MAMGDYQKALETLLNEKVLVNQVAKHETFARIYEALCNKDKAIDHLE